MRKYILLIISFLFLAFSFSGNPPQGWFVHTLPVNKNINDIYFVDSLTGWCVTIGGGSSTDSGYVLKTTNNGVNWSVQFSGPIDFTAIQFLNMNTGYSIGYDVNGGEGTIYKTTNSGLNWNIAHNHIPVYYEDLAFINKDTGWICSSDPIDGGVFKTTNGGASLQTQLNSSYHVTKLFFINQDTGWCGGIDRKLYKTTNGGINWNMQYFFPQDMNDIFFISKDSGWVITSAQTIQNGVYFTSNAGINWTLQPDPTPSGSGTNKIFFIDNQRGWVACTFSTILRTTNAGANWYKQTSPSFITNAIFFTDSLTGWAGGTKLIRTNDGGGPLVSIQQLSTETPTEYKLFQNYPNPFNPSTNFKFQISKYGFVSVKVYDITGKEVAILINENIKPGEYNTEFIGNNLSSGIYFYSLFIDGVAVDTKKMMLLK
jgi:photosystem II stability/assembly factor-like uncharacterized protein